MLIWAEVFIYQNKIINKGKHHVNSLYRSWIVSTCDGDTALSENVANSCDGDTALSEHVANSCDDDTALSEHVAKVINRTLTAVVWSSVGSIQ